MTENYEEWQDLTEGMIVCEFCSIQFSEEAFYLHLSEHTMEEVKKLKELAELSLKDEEAYETLCWELIRLEYFERLKEGLHTSVSAH